MKLIAPSSSLLVLFSCLSICGQKYNIVINGIPKAGNHLVADCVGRIEKRQRQYGFPILSAKDLNEKIINKANQSNYFITHLPFDEQYSKMLKEANFKGIFICRDPRDQLVSFLEWIYEHPGDWPKLQGMSRDELLSKLIYCEDYKELGLSTPGVLSNYSQYTAWKNAPNFITVKFEELVGPKARKVYNKNVEKKQFKVIAQIAQHIGHPIQSKQAKKIGKTLFGQSPTFRKGKIGSWQTYFTEKHKAEFKDRAGTLLADLGYIKKNQNW